jgi:hypothetical protein
MRSEKDRGGRSMECGSTGGGDWERGTHGRRREDDKLRRCHVEGEREVG